MKLSAPIPIFRIFDDHKAREFYIDFLDFRIDWEHVFEEGLPVYMQISKGDCILHLSEHFGDCCPGAAVRIQIDDVSSYQKTLVARKYRNARPGVEEMPWGTHEMKISDPFGNRLVFVQNKQN